MTWLRPLSLADSSCIYYSVSNSIGKQAGTDSKDVGAHTDAFNAAIAGVMP